MANYTDEQIKKGLWRCSYQEKVCPHCHFQENGKNCKEILMKNALDLINRQEAEIERLKDERQYLRSKLGLMHDMTYITHKQVCGDDFLVYSKEANGCEMLLDSARSEAIKEFAERLKRSLTEYPDCYFKESVTSTQIDNIVKEMVGEGE